MTHTELQQALSRASNPQSATNIATVIQAGRAKGLDAHPGENVLTFAAWKAKGRTVRKGEKALCFVTTFFERPQMDQNGTRRMVKMTKAAAVFHISQTEALTQRQEA